MIRARLSTRPVSSGVGRSLSHVGAMSTTELVASAARPRSRQAWPGLRSVQPGSTSESRTVDLPNRGLTYVRDVAGPPGAPVALLLHGWTGTADLNWSSSFDALSRHFRVIALDQRGHGRGLRAQGPFTLEACADDAAALLRVLEVREAVVVGYSMGGSVAQLMWRRHPNVVAGLVLCATSDHFSSSRWEGLLFSLAPIAAAVSRYVHVGPAARAVGLLRQRSADPAPLGRLAAEALARHDWQAILEALGAIGQFDSRPWVGAVDVPTAVVVTTNDHVVPPRRQASMGASVVGASIHEVRADHDACLRHPDLFVPALVRACRELVDHWPVAVPTSLAISA
jgi:3-oxoadipate enol-lactonase